MRRVRLYFASIMLCGAGACEHKPAPPPTVTHVTVRVVIVLQTTENAGVGTNHGCRLSYDQINQYKQHLNDFAKKSKYGTPIEFDFVTTEVLYLGTFNRPFPLTVWNGVVMSKTAGLGEPHWDENKINLYFTGWVVNNTVNPAQSVQGTTLDPSDVGDCFQYRHYILFNDRAGNVADAPAVVNLDDRILEHEMGHFLLRQRSGQGGHYDVAEHDEDTATHLMRRHNPHGDVVATNDQTDIKPRVQAGLSVDGGVLPPCQ